jgi:integrase
MLPTTPACDERRDDMGVLEQGNQSHQQHSSSTEKRRKKTGGVTKYKVGRTILWKVDVWLKLPDQSVIRFRKRKIPTREQAEVLVAKRRAEAFEGQYFRRVKAIPLTVRDAWKAYEPVCEQNHKAVLTEKCRSQHLLRHLGNAKVQSLSVADVDRYRSQRLAERSIRGKPPASSTLDFEVELFKRILNYSLECGAIAVNPIAKAKLLRKPNVRTSVITEEVFRRLSNACEPALKSILTVAFDTGMRKREILDLRWEQVDLNAGIIRLAPQDTKGKEHRSVYMTARVRSVLSGIPRHLHSKHVFLNPRRCRRGGTSTACSNARGER